jgi:hypothetical protein
MSLYAYHATSGARLVADQTALDALGVGWSATYPTSRTELLATGLSAVGELCLPVFSDTGVRTHYAFYVVWSEGCTGGKVSARSAHDYQYTGTWARHAEANWSDESVDDRVDHIVVSGAHKAAAVFIDEAIENGTVSIYGITA